jgi:hypothetical protein
LQLVDNSKALSINEDDLILKPYLNTPKRARKRKTSKY